MPPKNKKELELEAQKLAEEEKKREEEERARQEEEKKKYEIKILQTGLECVLTDYYVIECLKEGVDQRAFTKEFLKNYYFREGNYNQNFREIDWKVLIEFLLQNFDFALRELALTQQQTKIFLNIMFQVLRQNDLKYTTFTVPKKRNENHEEVEMDEIETSKYISTQVRQQGEKTKHKDFELLKNSLLSHSIDQQPNKQKYFSPDQLQRMFTYVNNTYFAHYNLYSYVLRKEQRQKDEFQTVFVDAMTEIPSLQSGMFIPRDQKDEETLERERRLALQRQLEEEQEIERQRRQTARQGEEEEEEETLDPLALEIIREKIKETEAQLERQLEERQQSLNEKLSDLEKPNKKGAKK